MTSVFHLPKSLPPSIYEVCIALVDNNRKPKIKLGIQGADPQGRYKLGKLRVLPALEGSQ